MARPPRPSPRHWVVVVVLVAFVLAGVLPEQQAAPQIQVVGVKAGTANGTFSFRVDVGVLGGSQPLDVTALLFPVGNESSPREIDFYLDPGYPALGGFPTLQGLLDHLGPALVDRGYRGALNVVDAEGLARVLTSSNDSAVVMGSTAIPAIVLSNRTNLLTPWLLRGGTLVWTGDVLGAFIGLRGQTALAWNDSQNLGWEGEQLLLEAPIIGYPMPSPDYPTTATTLATWLGLRYPVAYVGARLAPLTVQGGLALGYVANGSNPSASISWIPVGRGGVVLFGYRPIPPWGLSTEDVVANDMAQILVSGIIRWDQAGALDGVTVHVDPGARAAATVAVTLPANATLVRLYVYSRGPLRPFALSQAFNVTAYPVA